jgi:hypothetical protein
MEPNIEALNLRISQMHLIIAPIIIANILLHKKNQKTKIALTSVTTDFLRKTLHGQESEETSLIKYDPIKVG